MITAVFASLLSIFQFHKGTIRTASTVSLALRKCKFQFHKGTIRTQKGDNNSVICILFQFHKGTIRTKMVLSPLWDIQYFNSIKVRLEQFSF